MRRPRDLIKALGQATGAGGARVSNRERLPCSGLVMTYPFGCDLEVARPQGWEAGRQALAGCQLGSP